MVIGNGSRVDGVLVVACRVGGAGADRSAGGGRRVQHGYRCSGRDVAADGDRLAAHHERSGIAGLEDEPPSGRPGTVDHDAIITRAVDAAAKEAGSDALSSRLLGHASADRQRDGGAGLTRLRGAAVAGRAG